jgi:hypothetical protein
MTAETASLAEPMTFGGLKIRVAARIDASEIARRGVRSKPISREALEALFVLPEQEVVRDSGLPRWALRALQAAPGWAVKRLHDGWIRTYRPPAHIAYVSVGDWSLSVQDQIDELRWMSSVAPRVVVTTVDGALRSVGLVRDHAVGLAVAEGDNAMWMLTSPSPTRVRLTCHRWWLAERVVELRNSAEGPNAMPSPSDRG